MTKTAENTSRDLQIAAANRLALYCEGMGISVYDVHAGVASLKGEGITRAILWSGHCSPGNTYHLERGVQRLGPDTLYFPEGRESLLYNFMPTHMLHLTTSALARGVSPCKARRSPSLDGHSSTTLPTLSFFCRCIYTLSPGGKPFFQGFQSGYLSLRPYR